MSIERDAWLTGALGRDAFHVDGVDQPNGPGFYFSKVDTVDIARVRALSQLGFIVVDVNMTFAVAPKELVEFTTGDGLVVEAFRSRDSDAILEIAGSCFRYSRFHLDPLISPETAHTVKREWIRSYVNGNRGDRLFVARAGTRAVGFLAALKARRHDEPAAVIDLIGVAPQCQGKGIGRALVRQFADHYASSCERLVVGTQAANIPSIRLYERCGFRLAESAYIMHLHAGATE